MKDTARVLGRMPMASSTAAFGQSIVEDLGALCWCSSVEWLIDEFHPTQILADFLTMIEHGRGKQLHQISFAYLGWCS